MSWLNGFISDLFPQKPDRKPDIVPTPVTDVSMWREIQERKAASPWADLKPLDTSRINIVDFPKTHYFQEEFVKDQIVAHHTVSGPGTRGDIQTWLNTTQRIGTSQIVERDGTVDQCFSSKYWAGHIGAGNLNLDRRSIGVELDSWGGLVKGDGTTRQFGLDTAGLPKMVKTVAGRYYAAYGNAVDVPMTHYATPWRGYYWYETYTTAQLRTLGELLLLWRDRYSIPLTYNADMWDVSQRALSGARGVWTHVSYRPATHKQDCHPQPELIDMLQALARMR